MILKTKHYQHVHFIGIGGIGMSGIAELLLNLGFRVSGSDVKDSAGLEKLRSLGANIMVGHHQHNVQGATVVAYSSAISETNPEMIIARERQIPIMRRAEVLAEIMRMKKGIAIAGTHGKTTTTSFLATILAENQLDPTYVIGGIVKNLKGHVKLGAGDFLVAEADESDGSFLLFNPIMSVITNIDNDHLDFHKTQEQLFCAFIEFANKVPFYGVCALNMHDPNLRQLAKYMKRPWASYGIKEELSEMALDFAATNLQYQASSTRYDLEYRGEVVASIGIQTPGRHNVLNSLGAISAAYHLGLSFAAIAKVIGRFEGVGRRFQVLYDKNNLEIVDDYGHHPTEVATTISAARLTRPQKKIIVLFEPHRYTRTRDCWKDFFHCFNLAEKVHLAPIYPASEEPIAGIESAILAEDINRLHPGLISYLPAIEDILPLLQNRQEHPVLLLCMGAGTIGKRIHQLINQVLD